MKKDISNKQFGRLTAIKPTGQKRWGVNLWHCICQCGNKHIAAINSLNSGLVKSCGCLLKETSKITSTRHGDYGSPTYKSWGHMMQRCYNKNLKSFKNYGGRGISVCESWKSYENFKKDMGERPPNSSLDRIDVNANYTPDNCRWASAATQARNQRRQRLTYEQAQQIREMYLQGANPKFISDILKVSVNQVGSVVYLGNVSSKE